MDIDGMCVVHATVDATGNVTVTRDKLAGIPGAPGDVGPEGPPGSDGYTPIKGVDYWTQADQQSIVDDVLAALPVAEGVGF